MLIFDNNFKIELYLKAENSARKRAHHNIHNDFSDSVQRLAIALLKGTYIPPHKHLLTTQWEFFHVIEGDLKLLCFSEDGLITDTKVVGQSTGVFAIQIPPGIIHSLVCLTKRAMIFEWKEGPFKPEQAKCVLPWTIPEDDQRADKIVKIFETAEINDDVRNVI
ncbi:WbuC family cupin fold metalloprotein [Erwinia rhapontici]|uniref:WbuC family cupin fold metalloprotein n=1 Tax=Erwinia rhapontici TaxID=55212 RepID=UPI003BA2ADA5